MGVFSKNRFNGLGYSEVEPNENYYNVTGALQMMTESYQNDQAMFEAVLLNDFAQTAALNEGMEFEILTESGISSFFEKIKEFVKKAWAKIVGLFKAFIIKLNSVIIKSNKEFFNKYKKDVFGKDLSKMKFKFSKRTSSNLQYKDLSSDAQSMIETIYKLHGHSAVEAEQDKSSSDILDELLCKIVDGTDEKSFTKDYHEEMFEDEETFDGMESSILSHITKILSGDDMVKEANKVKSNSDKYFNIILKSISKAQTVMVKGLPDNKVTNSDITTNGKEGTTLNVKGTPDYINKKLNLMYNRVSLLQKANNMSCAAFISACKFDAAQCRRVYAKAAAFNPKAVKEDALYFEAVGEAAEFEVMSSFNDYEF